MSGILHEIPVKQAGEVEQAVRVGVHLGSNLASQVRLSLEDLEVIKQLSPPQIVHYLQDKYIRDNSLMHLFGYDRWLLNWLLTALVMLLVIAVLKFVFDFWRSYQKRTRAKLLASLEAAKQQ